MSQIRRILDFVSEFDIKIDKFHDTLNFMFDSHHNTLSSDLYSIVMLFLSNQKIQMNIISRHFIETILYCLFADMLSNFYGTFYPLFYNNRKPFRIPYRIDWKSTKAVNSIRGRLEDIKILNVRREAQEKFYKLYFTKASDVDIEVLFSLPICWDCYRKKKEWERKTQFIRINSLSDIPKSKFKSHTKDIVGQLLLNVSF